MPNYDAILEDLLIDIYKVTKWAIDLTDYSVSRVQQSLKDVYFTYREHDTDAKKALEGVLKKISEISQYTIMEKKGKTGASKMQEHIASLWDKYTRRIMEEEA